MGGVIVKQVRQVWERHAALACLFLLEIVVCLIFVEVFDGADSDMQRQVFGGQQTQCTAHRPRLDQLAFFPECSLYILRRETNCPGT